jgi:hypothetical protein
VKAAEGNKDAEAAFARLGVAFTNANGTLRDTEEVMRDLAKAFSEFPEGPEKGALAVEFFGKTGKQFIPAMNDDLDALAEHARNVGAIFSEDLVRSSRDYEKASAELEQTMQGIRNTIAEGVLPTLTVLKGALDDLISEFLGVDDRAKASAIIQETLSAAIKETAYWVAFAVDVIVTLKDIFMEGVEVANLFSNALYAVATSAERAGKLDFAGARQSLEDFKAELLEFQKNTQARLEREPLRFKVEAAFDRQQALQDFEEEWRTFTEEDVAQFMEGKSGGTTVTRKPQKEKRDTAAEKEERERQAALKRLAALEERNEKERIRDQERASNEKLKLMLKGYDEEEKAKKKAEEQAQRESEKHAKELADNARAAYEEQKKINQQYEDIFVSGLATGFTELIEGTKSVKDAVKDMAKGILEAINQIIAKKVATQLIESAFGSSDPATGGGIGGFFSKLFGPSRAFGGPFQAGQMIKVGERGPEYIRPNFSGMVEPSAGATHNTSNNVSVSVSVPPVTDRRSADQIGATVGLAVNRALRRTQ